MAEARLVASPASLDRPRRRGKAGEHVSERANRGRPGSLYRACASRALRLYPRAWRERYGEEVVALLREHHAGPWTVLDVVLGALDAHLHRDLLPGRIVSMAHRIRTSEITIFCASILFFVPWLALQRVPDPIPEWQADVARHPEIALAFNAMEVAGSVAFLAIVLGAIPIVYAALRQAFAARRRDILLPFGAAALAVVLYAGLTVFVFAVSSSRPGTGVRPLRPVDIALELIWLAASLVGAVAGTALVSLAVARSELSERVVRVALIPAAVATAALAAGVGAALTLTILTAQRSADLYNPIVSPIAMALMSLAAVLAIVALWRGLTTRSASPGISA
jgi:hypothetical protein